MAKKPGHDVKVIKVDPTVWAEAMKMADGDGRRIEIRGEFDVVVHNEPLPPHKRYTQKSG